MEQLLELKDIEKCIANLRINQNDSNSPRYKIKCDELIAQLTLTTNTSVSYSDFQEYIQIQCPDVVPLKQTVLINQPIVATVVDKTSVVKTTKNQPEKYDLYRKSEAYQWQAEIAARLSDTKTDSAALFLLANHPNNSEIDAYLKELGNDAKNVKLYSYEEDAKIFDLINQDPRVNYIKGKLQNFKTKVTRPVSFCSADLKGNYSSDSQAVMKAFFEQCSDRSVIVFNNVVKLRNSSFTSRDHATLSRNFEDLLKQENIEPLYDWREKYSVSDKGNKQYQLASPTMALFDAIKRSQQKYSIEIADAVTYRGLSEEKGKQRQDMAYVAIAIDKTKPFNLQDSYVSLQIAYNDQNYYDYTNLNTI